MKKIFKNPIFTFVLGALLFSGITVYAVNISSINVEYDNTNSGLNSTNVEGAINELYEDASKKMALNTFGSLIQNYSVGQRTQNRNTTVVLEKGRYIVGIGISEAYLGSKSSSVNDVNYTPVCLNSNCIINKLSEKKYEQTGTAVASGSSYQFVRMIYGMFYVDVINDVDTLSLTYNSSAYNSIPEIVAIQAIPINE